MATAVDALDSLESIMLEDGQADQTEVDYQSERIMQDLLQRVSK
jgi:ubiquinone biosynthesis protein COQ9